MRSDDELLDTPFTLFQITDKAGPDTGTWSMHTVGWLEFGEEERAASTFKMMLRNVNDPFKVKQNFYVVQSLNMVIESVFVCLF